MVLEEYDSNPLWFHPVVNQPCVHHTCQPFSTIMRVSVHSEEGFSISMRVFFFSVYTINMFLTYKIFITHLCIAIKFRYLPGLISFYINMIFVYWLQKKK